VIPDERAPIATTEVAWASLGRYSGMAGFNFQSVLNGIAVVWQVGDDVLGFIITMFECEVDWARKKNRRKDAVGGCGHGLRGRRNWLAS